MKRLIAVSATIMLLGAVGSWAVEGQATGGVGFPKEWRQMTHVKSMVIPDKNSGLYGFHHIYVNKKGLEALGKGGTFKEDSEFVGAFYDVVTEKDGSITQGKKLFTVLMRKDDKAKSTGGWLFAAFDADGKYMTKDYKKDCFDCHAGGAKATDFVFSKFIP